MEHIKKHLHRNSEALEWTDRTAASQMDQRREVEGLS
jgi:hypothetical protein